MTNREWLESLSDEELAKWFDDNLVSCTPCIYRSEKCNGNFDCANGHKKWLQTKHEKED